MRTFEEIFDISAARHDGAQALEAQLPRPHPTAATLAENLWLSLMARCVFQAGFGWKVMLETCMSRIKPAKAELHLTGRATA